MIALVEIIGIALSVAPVEWLMEQIGELYAPKPRPDLILTTSESRRYYGDVALRLSVTVLALSVVATLMWRLIKI